MIAPTRSRPATAKPIYYAETRKDSSSSNLDQFSPAPEQWEAVNGSKLREMLKALNPVKTADDYTSLFDRDKGWTGADGTYSLPQADGSTLWLFSDTFWGTLNQDGSRGPDTRFVNNSIARQSKTGKMEFFHGGGEGTPQSLFVPPDGKGWFWVHDAVTQESGKNVVFLGQFDKTQKQEALGFESVGLWMAEMEMTEDGPKVSAYQKLPHFCQGEKGQPGVFFGSATLQHGEYSYLYGVKDHGSTKDSILARVKTQELSNSKSWEFFDGQDWSKELDDSKVVAPDVSMEYSVHKGRDGNFVMVSQRGALSAEIQVRTAPSPEGPWSEAETIYSTPETQGSDLTYNAKAHPELSDERGLLISYNVNSMDWDRNLQVADVYRPRFIRLKDSKFLPNKKTPEFR